MNDIKRACFQSIQYLLKRFPCVAVLGARQVGKTTLLNQIYPRRHRFDLEKQADFDRIQRDPDFFLSQYAEPIIVDEAQTLPSLFPALRVAIDRNRRKNGQYLISGSSSPALLSKLTESLAGRMALFELSGFSMQETWALDDNILYELLSKRRTKDLSHLKPRLPQKKIIQSCLFGGYPEPVLKFGKDPKAFWIWMENYFQSYIQRDVRNLFPGLDIQTYQRFVSMLGGSSGQILNVSEFARSLGVSQPTARSYFDIAHGTFVWRMLPSFQKQVKKRVVKMPKGHMRDSGLCNFLLRNRTEDEFQAHPLSGRIWEGFIIEELLKGFGNSLIQVEPYFYRTNHQAEVDLVLEGEFGILPIEIKLGTTISHYELRALRDFVDDHRLPLGVIINNASEVVWLDEKIIQIPAGCL
jgi:hypothetical protein